MTKTILKKVGVLFAVGLSFILYSLMAYPSAKSASTDHITYKYTFSNDAHFTVSYADYPKGEDVFYELHFKENVRLPQEIKTTGLALKISGNNHSDDLFMYAYKPLDGLKANTTYHVDFSLELASNAPMDAIGAGGSPGSSVFVKIGVVAQKPARYLDNHHYYRMKLDKGEQGNDGKDMVLIGTVGVDTSDLTYRLKTLPYQPDIEMQEKLENYRVTTNEKGEAFLIFGTDSGYESTSTLFYTNVIAAFKEIK